MIPVALTLVALAQAPLAVATVHAPRDAVSVRGEAELSPAAAFASAQRRAEEQLRERWRARAQRLVVDQRPFWLPAALAEHAATRWLASRPDGDGLRIVDREDRVREHEFGRSYQTTLWVTEDRRVVARGEDELRGQLARVRERALCVAGGAVVFWGALAMFLSWIDRLSRGYMTGRLVAIGVSAGAVVPALAFLL